MSCCWWRETLDETLDGRAGARRELAWHGREALDRQSQAEARVHKHNVPAAYGRNLELPPLHNHMNKAEMSRPGKRGLRFSWNLLSVECMGAVWPWRALPVWTGQAHISLLGLDFCILKVKVK